MSIRKCTRQHLADVEHAPLSLTHTRTYSHTHTHNANVHFQAHFFPAPQSGPNTFLACVVPFSPLSFAFSFSLALALVLPHSLSLCISLDFYHRDLAQQQQATVRRGGRVEEGGWCLLVLLLVEGALFLQVLQDMVAQGEVHQIH